MTTLSTNGEPAGSTDPGGALSPADGTGWAGPGHRLRTVDQVALARASTVHGRAARGCRAVGLRVAGGLEVGLELAVRQVDA